MGLNQEEKESFLNDVPYWRRASVDANKRASKQRKNKIEKETCRFELHSFT